MQGVVGVHTQEAGNIDEREENISQLFFDLLGVLVFQRFLELGDLLVEFGKDLFQVVPVESHLAGLFLQTMGAKKGRKGAGNPFKDRFSVLMAFFFAFYLFPVRYYLAGSGHLYISKYVRVAADHLVMYG